MTISSKRITENQWSPKIDTSRTHEMFSLYGKTIVITGAAGLLGRQHAEAVAAFGGNPILLDIALQPVEKLAEELNESYGVRAAGYAVDITEENQIESNCQLVMEQYNRIDGLINNAANNPKVEDSEAKNFSRLENFPISVWQQDVAVGLTGAFLCSKHYGSAIARNPSGGTIINISSDLGLIAPDQRLYSEQGAPRDKQSVKPITYSVVKSGIIGLTRYLATYWTDENVRCNAIAPGGIRNGQSDEFLREVSHRIPLNRLAEPNEYQSTLLWMLGDGAKYLNGAIVPVDGGRSAW